MLREEEAEARRQQRLAEERTPSSRGPEAPAGGASAWRRPSQRPAATPSPTPSPAPVAVAAAATPAADGAPGKYRPGAFRGGATGGGWRERQAAKAAEADPVARRPESPATPPAPAAESGWRAREAAQRRTESPATPPAVNGGQTKGNDDGFQTVPSKTPWRPSRGRGTTRP